MANILSVTNATPIVVTAVAHGFTTGDFVNVENVSGTTSANGTWFIIVLTADTFSLTGSAGNGSFVPPTYPPPTATRISPAAGTITGATNATPIVVTMTAHGLSTGDYINVYGVGGNTAANGSWPIEKIDADTFKLTGSVGNSAYTSGGNLVKIPLDGSTNSTFISSTTTSTGTGDITIADDVLRSFPDGAALYFEIYSGSTFIENGLAKYNQSANSVSIITVGDQADKTNFFDFDITPTDLQAGTKSMSFCVNGPLSGGSSGLDGSTPVTQLPGPSTWPGLTTEQSFGLACREMQRPGCATSYIAYRKAGGGFTIRFLPDPYDPTYRGLADPFPVPPPRQTFPGIAVARPQANASALTSIAGRIVRVSGAVATGLQIASLAVQNVGGQAGVVQGILSPRDHEVYDDTHRIGHNLGKLYFTPCQVPGLDVNNAIITLHFLFANVQGGWSDFKIRSGLNSISQGVGIGTTMSLNINSASVIPFSVDAAKLPTQATVRAGVPFDVFAYVQSYVPYGSISLQHPKMFYLNWYSATERNNGLTGSSKNGHSLTVQDGVLCLKVFQESMNTDTSMRGGFPLCDKLYLYLGTCIPLSDGSVSCVPNLRLIRSHYNAINYVDDTRDSTPAWQVNPCNLAQAAQVFERMNPSGGPSSSWRHYFVDSRDSTGGTDVASCLPGMRAVARVTGVGRVQIRLLRQNGDILAQDKFSLPATGQPIPLSKFLVAGEVTMTSANTQVSGLNYFEVDQSYILADQTITNFGKKWGFIGSGAPVMLKSPGELVATAAEADTNLNGSGQVPAFPAADVAGIVVRGKC